MPEGFDLAVGVFEDDVGVLNSVEHCGFYGCVVVHVLEGQAFAGFEFVVEPPVALEVAAEAGVTTEAVEVFAECGLDAFGDGWEASMIAVLTPWLSTTSTTEVMRSPVRHMKALPGSSIMLRCG